MTETTTLDSQTGIPEPIEPGGGKSSRRGCLFRALAIVGVLAALLAIAGYFMLRALENRMEDISHEKPLEMPTPHRSAERKLALVEQVEAFLRNIEAGNKDRLELTGDDINILLSHYTPMEEKGWRIHAGIDGSIIRFQASIPINSLVDMTPFPLQRVGNRYMNGTFDFEISMRDGELSVFLVEADLGDQSVTNSVRAELQHANLADELEDSGVGAWIRKLNTIEVKNGVLILER